MGTPKYISPKPDISGYTSQGRLITSSKPRNNFYSPTEYTITTVDLQHLPPKKNTDTPFSLPSRISQHKTHLELFVEGTPNPNAFVQHLGANQSSGCTARAEEATVDWLTQPVGCHWGLHGNDSSTRFFSSKRHHDCWRLLANSYKKLQQCMTFQCLKPKKLTIVLKKNKHAFLPVTLILNIYITFKKTMKLIKILIPTCFCSDFF